MASDQYIWFDSSDVKSNLLSPIHELNDDRNDWDIHVLSDEKDNRKFSTITLVDRSCEEVYRTSKQDVEAQVAAILAEDEVATLSSELQNNFSLATNAFKSWRSDRRATASRKGFTALQHTASTIGDFLQSFSGVAETLKGADQQFGGLAYGTVSILLGVAIQKQKREEAIEEALEELSYAFPRLETLRRVRPKETLRALIVDVFTLVIKFCRETVDYFAQRTRRLTKALSPLKLKTLTQLRAKLSEIKEECTIATLEELAETRKTLAKVQEQLKRIETTGDDTNLRVRQGHEWMQLSHSSSKSAELREISHALGLKPSEDISTTVIVSKYMALLQDEFSDLDYEEGTECGMSWAVLKGEKKFTQWMYEDQSSMLLLGGNNLSDLSSTVLNWLSMASVLVAQADLSTGPKLTYFCSTDYTNSRSRRRSFSDVICGIIYQLAEQHSEFLTEWPTYITEALQSPEWNSDNYSDSFEVMAQLCIKLFSKCQAKENLTIVIDRLDLCQWSYDEGMNELYESVCSLRDIVRDKSLSHLRIKILLVMEGRPAQQVVKLFGGPGRGIDWKVNWDQSLDDD